MPDLIYEKSGEVATLTRSRPHRCHVIRPRMMVQLADPAPIAVVLLRPFELDKSAGCAA